MQSTAILLLLYAGVTSAQYFGAPRYSSPAQFNQGSAPNNQGFAPNRLGRSSPSPFGFPGYGPSPPPAQPSFSSPFSPSSFSPSSPSSLSSGMCDEKCSQVLGLVNKHRNAAGLGSVCLRSELMDAALQHSRYQGSIATMTHDGPMGTTVGDRVKATGYKFKQAGENVAYGQETASQVMIGWMHSEGHRENILTPGYTQMGIAVATGADGLLYWTQVFGSPLGSSQCDLGTSGGMYGSLQGTLDPSAGSVMPDIPCDETCQAVIAAINVGRGQAMMPPLCKHSAAMAVAQEMVEAQSRGGELSGADRETTMLQYGYSASSYAANSFQLSYWGQKPSMDSVFNYFRKVTEAMGDFEAMGVGMVETSSTITVLALYTKTTDTTGRKCDDQTARLQGASTTSMISPSSYRTPTTSYSLSPSSSPSSRSQQSYAPAPSYNPNQSFAPSYFPYAAFAPSNSYQSAYRPTSSNFATSRMPAQGAPSMYSWNLRY